VPLFKEVDGLLRGVIAKEQPSEATDARQLFEFNLHVWGPTIPHIGRFLEKLAYMQEGAEECRKMISSGGAMFEPQLHRCIEHLAYVLDTIGRFDEASSTLRSLKNSTLRNAYLESVSKGFAIQNARLFALIARAPPSASEALHLAFQVEEIAATFNTCDSTFHRRITSDVWYQLSETSSQNGDLSKALRSIKRAIPVDSQTSSPLPMFHTDDIKGTARLS